MATDTDSLEAEIQQLRQDAAFLNAVTGLGISGKDKMASFDIAGLPDLAPEKLAALYRADTFAGNIVELLPDAATKKWIVYTHEGDDPAGVAKVQAALDKLKGPINEAMILARLYGGAVIVLGADDGAVDFAQPLNLHQLRAIRWHTVMSKAKIKPIVWEENPMLEGYNQPLLYELTDKARTKIHASRLIRFDGVKLPAEILRDSDGWGDSVLLRPYRDMVAFEGSLATVAAAMQDFSVPVMEMNDLSATSERPNGQQIISKRVGTVALVRNALGMMLIDGSTNKYSFAGRDFSNITEVLGVLRDTFIGSTDLPPSKLMALFNSAGIASEDTTQQREWSDFVLSRQEDDLRPVLTDYLKLLHLSKEGPTAGVIPVGAKFDFEPIFQLNEQEEAKLHGERAKEWDIYLKAGVVSPDEVAEALAKDVPLASVIDIEARKREAGLLRSVPEGQISGT